LPDPNFFVPGGFRVSGFGESGYSTEREEIEKSLYLFWMVDFPMKMNVLIWV